VLSLHFFLNRLESLSSSLNFFFRDQRFCEFHVFICHDSELYLFFVYVTDSLEQSATSVAGVLAKMTMWWERKLRSITWSAFVVAPARGGSKLAMSSLWDRTASSVDSITMFSRVESTAPEVLVFPEARITITPPWRTTIIIYTQTTVRCQVKAWSFIKDWIVFSFFPSRTIRAIHFGLTNCSRNHSPRFFKMKRSNSRYHHVLNLDIELF